MSVWIEIGNVKGPPGPVKSVNGQHGDVVISPETIGAYSQEAGAAQVAEEVSSYLADHPPVAGEPLLAEHIVSPTPHPAYDDMLSLTAVFENGLI